MDEAGFTILLSIEVSIVVLVVAADRRWLRPRGEVLRHPVRTVAMMLHNVRVMLRG